MSIRMITPDPIEMTEIEGSIDVGLLSMTSSAKALFKLTYWNWETENQPAFETKGPKTLDNHREVEYSTPSTPYVWIDSGTERHEVHAKNFPVMSFQTGGSPKTKPGKFTSMAGSPHSEWQRAAKVNNPGIAARDFSGEATKRLEQTAGEMMQISINKTKSV